MTGGRAAQETRAVKAFVLTSLLLVSVAIFANQEDVARPQATNASHAIDEKFYVGGTGFFDVEELGKNKIVARLQYLRENGNVIRHAYLHQACRLPLEKALKNLKPNEKLVVYDAFRIGPVQEELNAKIGKSWRELRKKFPGPPNETLKDYVGGTCDRQDKSGHLRGLAVDITLEVDGKVVNMGTPFDAPSTCSRTDNEGDNGAGSKTLGKGCSLEERRYLTGDLPWKTARENRERLRAIMKVDGFKKANFEWWHFECDKPVARLPVEPGCRK